MTSICLYSDHEISSIISSRYTSIVDDPIILRRCNCYRAHLAPNRKRVSVGLLHIMYYYYLYTHTAARRLFGKTHYIEKIIALRAL